jgi:aminoglycoside 3-N-acetyltransferase
MNRRRYTANDLVRALIPLGLKPGTTVFVHSSWNEFFNLDGRPVDLIDALLETIGPRGTLAMPAFPPYAFQEDPSSIFDVRRTPTAAGLLAEAFRRRSGVRRSINMNHSVCAVGPEADFLLRDHHRSETSWDQLSPYYRLRDVDALIIGLGVGRLQATALHCVDSLLWREVPFFRLLAQEPRTYRYLDAAGQPGEHSWTPLKGKLARPELVVPHLPGYSEAKPFGLASFCVSARQLIDTAVDLGRRGITMWVDPPPRPELFVNS